MIIPCYNNEIVLVKVYKELSKALKSLPVSYEFIFIDNGSRDNTLTLLRQIAEEDYNCNFLSLSHNVSKMEAVFIGAKLSTGEYIGFMDCYHPSKLIPSFFHALNSSDFTFVGGEVLNDNKNRKKQIYFKMACTSLFKDIFLHDNLKAFCDRFYHHKEIHWIPYRELEHVESPWENRFKFIEFQKYTIQHPLLTPVLLVIGFIILPLFLILFYDLKILLFYLLSIVIIILLFIYFIKRRQKFIPHGEDNIKESTF